MLDSAPISVVELNLFGVDAWGDVEIRVSFTGILFSRHMSHISWLF